MGFKNVPPPLPAAMAACPDCQREVSRQARHCVHCGRPWPVRSTLKRTFWFGLLLIASVAAGSGSAILALRRSHATLNAGTPAGYTGATNR